MTLGTPESVKISMEIELQLLGSAANLNNHFTLSVGMDTLELFASLLAKIDVAQLLSLKLKDAFNMYCWMDTVLDPKNHEDPTAGIEEILVAFQTIAMGLECVNCTFSVRVSITVTRISPLDQHKHRYRKYVVRHDRSSHFRECNSRHHKNRQHNAQRYDTKHDRSRVSEANRFLSVSVQSFV